MKLYPVVLSPGAQADLREIAGYIASQADTELAERFVDAIAAHCRSFSLFPNRGTKRRGASRTIGYDRRVTIRFKVRKDYVEIVAIAYRGRQI